MNSTFYEFIDIYYSKCCAKFSGFDGLGRGVLEGVARHQWAKNLN